MSGTAKCPNCGTEFQIVKHAPRGSGSSYVVKELNEVHIAALKVLKDASGALPLPEITLRVNEERKKFGMTNVVRNGIGGRLSEMQNEMWGLTVCYPYMGRMVWSITEKGRAFLK